MSDFDANFKVGTPIILLLGNKPQLDRQLDRLLLTSTFTSSNPTALCKCAHASVSFWI